MGFDGEAYIEHIGKRLVDEFAFAARAGTPVLVGSAKEHPARVQLSKLIHSGLSVGSGIVVDSFGGQSKQQDIVVYENISPVFSHSNDPLSTYFPVEGVIACGEVKSVLGSAEIKDSFAKCMSVKRLRRFAEKDDGGLDMPASASYRLYNEKSGFLGAGSEMYDQDTKPLDHVMTFVLCERFSASPETTTSNFAAQFRENGSFSGPNIVASLNDGFILGVNQPTNSLAMSVMDANSLFFCKQRGAAFSMLVWLLRQYGRCGRTVGMKAFERYFSSRPYSGGFTIDFLERL